MIHTSRQLKALVRNMSKGDSSKAQTIIRNYAIERFLERLSYSSYRKSLILKGGILIASMIGLDNRSTMDVDATINNLPLSVESARRIVGEIISIPLEDGMSFEIISADTIMDEADTSGVRIMLDAALETMRIPLIMDFSSGDVITPGEITYSFRLLFEDRNISILAYNLETVLAEKLETLIIRGTANTRIRDFYDIYAFETTQAQKINATVLKEAFANTSRKRNSLAVVSGAKLILGEIEASPDMAALWKNYQRKFAYAAEISWGDVMKSVRALCGFIL